MVAGVAFVGNYLNTIEPVLSRIDAALPVRTGVANSDIVRSYLGLLLQGKSDLGAIENVRGDRFFREALGEHRAWQQRHRRDVATPEGLTSAHGSQKTHTARVAAWAGATEIANAPENRQICHAKFPPPRCSAAIEVATISTHFSQSLGHYLVGLIRGTDSHVANKTQG